LVSKHLPDVATAVNCFLANFRKVRYLPFIADAEAEALLGAEVSAALVELDAYNRQNQVCHGCQGHCCPRVKCELYDVRFSGCPVEAFRPVLCRLHFCDKFNQAHGPLVKILGDIYLESLLAAAKIDAVTAAMFDCPAFTPRAPQLVSLIARPLDKARSGQLTEESARQEILILIEANALAKNLG
jgi:hypothetical protein